MSPIELECFISHYQSSPTLEEDFHWLVHYFTFKKIIVLTEV